jgi:hypothetical protein
LGTTRAPAFTFPQTAMLGNAELEAEKMNQKPKKEREEGKT